jgi:hypothetical protein
MITKEARPVSSALAEVVVLTWQAPTASDSRARRIVELLGAAVTVAPIGGASTPPCRAHRSGRSRDTGGCRRCLYDDAGTLRQPPAAWRQPFSYGFRLGQTQRRLRA